VLARFYETDQSYRDREVEIGTIDSGEVVASHLSGNSSVSSYELYLTSEADTDYQLAVSRTYV
jgi:hypothetical protein